MLLDQIISSDYNFQMVKGTLDRQALLRIISDCYLAQKGESFKDLSKTSLLKGGFKGGLASGVKALSLARKIATTSMSSTKAALLSVIFCLWFPFDIRKKFKISCYTELEFNNEEMKKSSSNSMCEISTVEIFENDCRIWFLINRP